MKKHILSTAFLFIIFNCSFLITKAQWVSIPDSNFGTWLNTNGYSACLQGNNTVGWQMDTTCPAIVNGTDVESFNSNIRDLTGIEYFDNLDTLVCSDNQLTSLPLLPSTLVWLDCKSNQLTSLPSLSGSLTLLDCRWNQLTSLPALPASLIELLCDNNQLTSLPALVGPLTSLSCRYNQLTTLPALPNSITWINCHHNQLTSLPTLPDSLRTLYCLNNQLTSIPALPSKFVELYCEDNLLISLPALPDSLVYLRCWNNQLTSIPELPPLLYQLSCDWNPKLFCLPRLNKIHYLSFKGTGITCLPNYPQEIQSCEPPLNSLPLCNTFNNRGCDILWNITGNTYLDFDGNCSQNDTDVSISNIKVQLWSGGNVAQQFYTGSEGFYSFDVDTLGIYAISIDPVSNPFNVTCPITNLVLDTLSNADSLDYNRNFAVACKSGFDLATYSIYTWNFGPARSTSVGIEAGDNTNFYAAHCAAGGSGAVTVTITGSAHYYAPEIGALTPIVNGDTLTYNVADFGAVDFFNDFNFVALTDTDAVLGSSICITVTITPIVGDYNPTNNILTQCFTVTSSFDPNEKQVYPSGTIDTSIHWLTYAIRFQNTGTDTAFNIYVTDTLNSNIDAASFQLLAYSHQPMVQLKGNSLRFNFPNINLPDSNTNEPLSHGYVQYKVKLKDNLPVGTNINNTAFIYFDFNAPVVTNTTSNTIALATSVANLGLRNADFGLNPNPATESVRISIDESMVGCNLTITDITGREVLHSAIQIPARTTDDVQSGGRNPQFDIRNLSHGLYFVTLESKTGRVTKKLVKQ